jgi:glycosyltransferase involved in cell wall biosynthesis
MEAAACGCAVVATANDGIQEYLEDGATMRMVSVGDARALARAADALLDDASQRIRLAEAARSEVARYRWSELSARFEALLQDYLAEHTPSPLSPP